MIIRGAIPSFTWLNKPASASFVGQAIISDVGINGSLWYSNGSVWVRESLITLYNTYLGIIFPSLAAANAATYSQSGATVTVNCAGHNIPATVHNGKSVYLTPGAPSTGAQLPTGLYTNFTYVDANTFTCTASASQTGTGPLNTQTSAITVTGFSVTVLGGLLGLNGFVDVYNFSMCNASAGTKRISFLYDTFSFKNPSPTSTTLAVQETHRFQNVNNVAKQIAHAVGSVGQSGPGTVTPVTSTINSNVDKNITAQVTLNTALDFITLEHVSIALQPG